MHPLTPFDTKYCICPVKYNPNHLCQKYRRPESEDYWLWARAFFDAPIFDLQAIAALVQ